MRSLPLLLLLLTACPRQNTPPGPAGESTFDTSAWVLTESGLRYEDVIVGTGTMVTPQSRIEAHYTGWLGDGSVFDSSLDRGEPLAITIGVGQVIKGWDEGIVGMRVGGKRKLLIPPDLGYGGAGAGPIPPNSTLLFEVEVLAVKPPRVPSATPASVDATAFTHRDSGLMIAHVSGSCDGEPHPAGTILSFEVDGFLESGKLFNSTRLGEAPLEEAAGMARFEPGLDEGLLLMPVGCVAQLRVPGELAFQGMRRPPTVPDGVGLTYDVEVLSAAPPRTAPEAPQPASNHLQSGTGLAVAILAPGEGEGAAVGDTVVVEYTGWLDDGTRFDSSYLRAKPIVIRLGENRVIAGWEEGLLGMRAGEKRQLIIPPALAYGEAGRPPVIPASATLTFEVEVVEIQRASR